MDVDADRKTPWTPTKKTTPLHRLRPDAPTMPAVPAPPAPRRARSTSRAAASVRTNSTKRTRTMRTTTPAPGATMEASSWSATAASGPFVEIVYKGTAARRTWNKL